MESKEQSKLYRRSKKAPVHEPLFWISVSFCLTPGTKLATGRFEPVCPVISLIQSLVFFKYLANGEIEFNKSLIVQLWPNRL
jgi:hypothetical protein